MNNFRFKYLVPFAIIFVMVIEMENKKRSISGKKIANSALFVVSAVACSYLSFASTLYAGVHHFKSQNQIIKDAISIDADLNVINKYDNKVVRLRFPENKPVYVICDSYIDKRYIDKAVNYYNSLFSTINENCKLEMVDDSFKMSSDDVCIVIKNGHIAESGTYGVNNGDMEYRGNKGDFIAGSTIVLDWDKMKQLNELGINYIVIHELGHSLGMKDVYTGKENYNYVNINTIMNVDNISNVDILYPSDYALLQAVYSDAYKNHKHYTDAIKEIQQEISDYRDYFYNYYSGLTKEKYPEIMNLRKDYIDNCKISWNNDNYMYSLMENDGECNLVISDYNKNIVDETTGLLTYSNGMFFIEGLEVDNYSYMGNDSYDCPYKFSLSLYIDDKNRLLVSDIHGYGTVEVVNSKQKIRS